MDWRILEADNNYLVNELGEIRNKKNGSVSKGSGPNNTFKIQIDGKWKTIAIHKVVAETFLENPMGYDCVRHIDGNQKNNLLENLEWCSRADINRYKNKQEGKAGKKCSSQYKNVNWDKKYSKWKASFVEKGKKFFVGYFETEEQAHEAMKPFY